MDGVELSSKSLASCSQSAMESLFLLYYLANLACLKMQESSKTTMTTVEWSSQLRARLWNFCHMDLGVCSFVLMNAVTSRQARNIKSSMSWWKAAFKSATPLLLLGFARLASTLNLDYQVHVGEYGVNWNMEFNILALFSHQDELCFRNSSTLCVCMCVFFLCIKFKFINFYI
ncbi:hypothetical protein ES319_A12G073600v1 [Gossypium barbadense]|uniref:Uncharacterized protein n=1 Tax=Gossypium barbadense TaxID=3634 RepID=A0A5J5TB85_GOSBA|nr:hypothetical protein ES319_A12G073600v1 [Gossypium barbadense]